MIIGRAYENLSSFFHHSFDSSLLNIYIYIYKVNKLGPLKCWKLKDVQEKIIRLPISQNHDNESMVVLPFIYSV